MNEDRRDFLKLAGLSLAGVGFAGPIAAAMARSLSSSESVAAGALKGRRWALVVDTRRCTARPGCDACIKACHTAHNVPSIPDPRHEVKWIWEQDFASIFPDQISGYGNSELARRPVLLACNHCEKPPCVRVCPTQSTWKRSDGVVMMDPHRCIGCRYCMAACPYGSRSFNWMDPQPYIAHPNPDYPERTRGVVEKCTLCDERLAVGQIPLCVEACHGIGADALVFGDLADPDSEVATLLRSNVTLRRKVELGTGPNIFYIA
jgi:Fe-S-cluster-containing dehydrogenase component